MRLCGDCHDEVSQWKVVRQLAMKKLADPDYYDRRLVNELRSKHPEAITEADVDAAAEILVGQWQARYQVTSAPWQYAWGSRS